VVDSYKGAKKLRAQRAVESLSSEDVNRRDSSLGSFVKGEKTLLSRAKPDPAPRIIQPRDPRYNVSLARYIRPLEHRVYRAIARVFRSDTVMKGLNSEAVACTIASHWDSFVCPVAIGLDASRFDQHVSVAALKWEHSVYNGAFRSKELARLLKWQLVNRGTFRVDETTVSYTVEGCRMSGDMNTSLGNCLIMCGLVWEYANLRKVRVKLVNNGDDCVVFLERGERERFSRGLREWFLSMGFNMKVEAPVYDINHIEFCQAKPLQVNGSWTMVRDPWVSLAKDGICLQPDAGTNLTIPAYLAWAESVGKCGLALAGGVPVMQEYYHYLITLVGKRNKRVRGFGNMDTGLEFMSRGMSRQYCAISEETRFQFWKAFDITPYMQVALEEEIRAYGRELQVSHLIVTSYLPSLCPCPENADPEEVED
jgi:hypothetical protein